MESSDVPTPPPPESFHRPPARRDRGAAKLIVIIVVLLAAAAATWFWFKGRAPAQDPAAARAAMDPRSRPTPVAVAKAELADVPVVLSAIGTVTPMRTATVRSRVDGQLLRVLFEEGELVKEGALLAEVDPRPYEVQLTQAQGAYERDKALLANARVDAERYRTLFEQDSIAKQQLDSQESLVRQYEGALRADQGAIDSARLQLTYTRITAPFAGRAGLRQVDAGNLVSAGDATGIVVITQVQPISVVFSIPQDDLPVVLARMREPAPVPVEAWDRAHRVKLATGQLAAVDNVIDTTTGTVKLRARFTNESGALFANQFVNVRLQLAMKHDAVVIPASAVQRGSKGAFVFVVQPDETAAQRNVVTSTSDGTRIAIDEGLTAGERVIIDGLDRLRDGAKVVVGGRGGNGPPGAGAEGAHRGDRPQPAPKADR